MRDTPGSCIVTPVSCLAISIVTLLCVMNTNWTFSDISLTMSQNRATLASSSGASTSSSRQNGAGFSSKIAKYECHGRQGFFATGQQVNRAVPLAGRACHDGHASRQQIVTGQFEIGVPTTKQLRKQAFEAGVDIVEGFAEPRPRFAINLANGTFERRQRIRSDPRAVSRDILSAQTAP